MKRASGVALILVFLFIYFTGLTGTKNQPSDQVDKYIEEQMSKLRITGLSLAIVKNGTIEKARGYGLANAELKVPAASASVYQIGSISKQFTATAIMLLVEENRLGLDDKISEYLSDTPLEWQNVTIRHLLTHTSGIKNYTDLPEFWQRYY